MREGQAEDRKIADRFDIECHYRSLLGRRPESEQVINQMLGTELGELPSAFICSDEFRSNVYDPVVAQQPFPAHLFREEVDVAIAHWMADRLVLGDGDAAAAARAVASWPEALIAIHDNGALIERFGDDALRAQLPAFIEGLRHMSAATAAAVGQVSAAGQGRSSDASVEVPSADVDRLRASGLFDATYYRRMVPVLPENANPEAHYLRFGARNFVNPGPKFDVISYLAACPEARDDAVDPVSHFISRAADPQAGFAADPDARWIGSVHYTDDEVHAERLRAAAFFYRYNLGAPGVLGLEHVSAAIAELAAREPSAVSDEPPIVSIIIPVYGQLPFVLHCLDSLAEHRSRFSFEIIVFDDASPERALIDRLSAIPWLRYVHGSQNRGFIGACNYAVSLARGNYVVLLNSDTRVCAGWLNELIDTFTAFPCAGLVGSKLYNADGSLQEAGGIVWEDGSAWNLGRDDNPTRPEYSYARRVDYCSGAAIALPRALWDELGGFDTHYLPAYYEDVDLAFRVRQAGRETWLQPLARVIHYEGITHGRDDTKGVKASQVVNAAKFHQRWRNALADAGANGYQPLKSANRTATRRMLALDALTPTPDRDAGSVMTVKLLEIFQKLGWHVSFVPTHDTRFDAKYGPDLQRAGIEVLRPDHGFRLDDYLLGRGDFYEAVLGFRVTVFASIVDRVRELAPSAIVMFHDIDLHHLRVRREAMLSGNRWLARQAEVLEDSEMLLSTKVDCTIVPSTVEKQILDDALGPSNVVVYSYTADVHRDAAELARRRHLVFVGGFRHTPNVDAMEYFVLHVWPALSERLPPDAKLIIVGSDAPDRLKALGSDRVVLTGFVEDLGPLLAECRVFVAPLRYGAGLKGKVVTSLSYGVPCVASAIAIEGMALEPGEHVLEANDTEGLIASVGRLYEDAGLWLRLREAGQAFVERQYGWEAGLETARLILETAEATWLRRRQAEREAWLSRLRSGNQAER